MNPDDCLDQAIENADRYRSNWNNDRNTVKNEHDYEQVIGIARKEIGVVERTNKNDGKRIAEYLNYMGIKEAAPWCAAYVSLCFWKAGHQQSRTAWSPALFPADRLVKVPSPGIVYGIYYAALGRIGHCGIVTRVKDDWVTGCEGNTNAAVSREGQGVYERIRHKRTISRFANWLK